MSESIKGRIHQVESFGSVDGPGVRYIVFLKGCHMRCRYCHPETWKEEGGTLETAQEVFDKAYRYRNYWKNGGGITVSGGEALLQMEFVTELFEIAKKNGVHTTLDTSGNPFKMEPEYLEKFDKLLQTFFFLILRRLMMRSTRTLQVGLIRTSLTLQSIFLTMIRICG